MTLTLRDEARILSQRTGLRAEACEKWMRQAGLTAVTDLMRRYPGVSHSDCMIKAGEEIEDFILG